TGMVVTLTAIILACTNLPREIDNRVIYTVVTKPTTRLEIVVGKVLGFARVSAAILLIMGIFSYLYLHARAWSMRRDIIARLEAGVVDSASRPTLEYWAQAGLLNSRTIEQPDGLEVLAREPVAGEARKWFFGSNEGEMLVPFTLSEQALIPPGGEGVPPGAAGLVVHVRVGFGPSRYADQAHQEQQSQSDLPVGIAAPTTAGTAPAAAPTAAMPQNAQLAIQILDQNLNSLIDPRQLNNGQAITLTDPGGQTAAIVHIPPELLGNLLKSQRLYVNLTGISSGVEYFVDSGGDVNDPLSHPVCLIVPSVSPTIQPRIITPMPIQTPNSGIQPAQPLLRARSGTYGQQLRGGPPDRSPVAIYRFRDAPPATVGVQGVAFEMRVGIERSGDDDADAEPTRLQITVVDPHNPDARSEPVLVYPENNRTAYFNLPAGHTTGGNFDVYIRNLTEHHYVGLLPASLSMISSVESFDWNLAKSLLILWMLSVLVVIISVFCSTFLSWPIAIVLTLVILLGHWGVMQLGDATAPGIGNLVATDLGFREASQAKVVSASVEAMARLLNALSKVLPDIGRFSAIEDIERGVTISAARLLAPLAVLGAFGLPMMVLSYVFLRNKEVAP
ncbi:MAG TPA: hypothetical protein VNL70_01380, partial [Tepidisphaeraceae bacterium]|nr:hypothetical protein [Tepidisphaeraceae bacterium]